MQRYFGDWDSAEGINRDFSGYGDTPHELVKDSEVLYAAYTYEDYSGNAFVVFERDGRLYEVNGGHCSCYGLEGQWEPEETTLDALAMRKLPSYSFGPEAINAFSAMVESRQKLVC